MKQGCATLRMSHVGGDLGVGKGIMKFRYHENPRNTTGLEYVNGNVRETFGPFIENPVAEALGGRSIHLKF